MWHIAVFCQNEQEHIANCLTSIAQSIGSQPARVAVIVNGSRDLTAARAAAAATQLGLKAEIYTIPAADKSNAINSFFHRLRRPASLYVCLDGYVRISETGLGALDECLRSHPHAVAVSGVAQNGRSMRHQSAQAVRRGGGTLHGQFYAFRPEFVDRICSRGLKLPVGLYRGDGLLGSMAAHDLDPMTQPWDDQRVINAAAAPFWIATLSVLRPQDWARQGRRQVRQMRGLLENAAIKDIIYRGGYEALPGHADVMIRQYVAQNGIPKIGWKSWLFMRLALRQLRLGSQPAAERLLPVLLASSDG